MRVRGWVYVITNESMPGLVKIGHTTKDPLLRANELASTGSPLPFAVAYDALVYDPRQVESLVHKRLVESRYGKEWFKCSIWDGVSAIRTCAGANLILENAIQPGHLQSPVKAVPPKIIIPCVGCGQRLRVPAGVRIRITCSRCGDVFEHGP